MSNQGSDFRERYLQEPSAKRAKLSNANAIDPTSGVLRLHTEWVQRDPGDRVAAYVGSPAESPIPVPQSDFEIEINSSNQDGGMSSPGQEISLTPTTNTNEPRILTIDNRTDVSLSSHPQDTAVTTTMVTSIPLQTEEIPLETHPSITTSADFSTIISSRGIMDQNQIQVEHQPLSTSGDLNNTPFILSSQSQAPQDGQSTGPLYVMIPPSSGAEILHAMSHTQTSGFSTAPYGGDDSRKQKDLVRKQTHNEVERRRRDRINELIKLLAEIVPGCQKKDASNGNIVGYVYSKGTVLEKTVEYVRDLMTQNEQLSAAAKLAEKSASALQVLQNQITVLEKENAFLRAQMIQIGIDTTSGTIAGRNLLPNSLAQSLLNTAQLQATPPPPTPSNNTTQLLVSLAQSLTNNPLLASLAQASSSTPPTNIPAVTQVTPSTQTQVSNSVSQAVATGNSNQANLLSSLVQVLSSMATPVPAQPPAPIPAAQPQQAGNISATAAMSLINSLLMAQSAINTPTHTSCSTSLPSSVANILGDHNADKATPT